MNSPIECPGCGEISLHYCYTSMKDPFIETWECDCGHVSCYHVQQKRENRYPGFDAFVERVGMEVLEKMSLVEALQMAFINGKTCEAKGNIEALKRIISVQAE